MIDTNEGYERTIISFQPMRSLLRQRGISDLQLAHKINEKVDVVRNIQLHPDTTTVEVIRKICQELHCNLEDIMRNEEIVVIPEKVKGPDN